MKRRTAREKALQALFQIEVGKTEVQDAIENALDGQATDAYLELLVQGTVDHQQEIDEILRENLENWTLERVANIDRNLMRIAIFEMLHSDEVPVNVAIDESLEIAKIFGDDQSSRFVNAVLSKVKDKLDQ